MPKTPALYTRTGNKMILQMAGGPVVLTAHRKKFCPKRHFCLSFEEMTLYKNAFTNQDHTIEVR